MTSIILLEKELEKIRKENQDLKIQLEFQTQKHEQWKHLAMTFHDSLWKMINTYMYQKH